MKRIFTISVIASLLLSLLPLSVFADQPDVVTLGADLNQTQREQILNYFGVNEKDVLILTVTNEEEKQYLEGLASEQHIGTRSYSSAHVKLASKGSGIDVKINNITWVTEEMYANAMVTAGIEDAKVNITAPFNVSGTAALTGIMKAFEKATGKKISPDAKKAANEELFITGDLGNDIGKEKAAQLIQKIKQQVVRDKIKNPDDIRKVIEFIAKELDITLTDAQIDQILKLMEKISRLDLSVDKISQQLSKISSSLDEVKRTVEENKGLIQKILDSINSFFRWLRQIFSAA